MLTRRQLIKGGVLGGVVLLGAGWLARPAPETPTGSSKAFQFLTPQDAVVVGAIAPAMLAVEALQVARVVQGVDQAIAALPLALQRELRQLFDLLGNPWGRRYLAGLSTPWSRADAIEVAAFLRRWQLSRLALLRTGYQALHALIAAAWYGNEESWPGIGYQRPARIMGVLQ
ncbi:MULTISPECIES: hypothetical protein [unclassified Paludibacterium]|uniref:hypothetical protein n=1 Tax=unclassified Paludibacterium TaxID=2618429 RepID=UPI001C03AF08|nr:hypothetical protein [Paludibacterium sp. B53371]BEV71253.1 hypothetical protein THUN1379_07350 [Paludibacterium sp. THUN1379]